MALRSATSRPGSGPVEGGADGPRVPRVEPQRLIPVSLDGPEVRSDAFGRERRLKGRPRRSPSVASRPVFLSTSSPVAAGVPSASYVQPRAPCAPGSPPPDRDAVGTGTPDQGPDAMAEPAKAGLPDPNVSPGGQLRPGRRLVGHSIIALMERPTTPAGTRPAGRRRRAGRARRRRPHPRRLGGRKHGRHRPRVRPSAPAAAIAAAARSAGRADPTKTPPALDLRDGARPDAGGRQAAAPRPGVGVARGGGCARPPGRRDRGAGVLRGAAPLRDRRPGLGRHHAAGARRAAAGSASGPPRRRGAAHGDGARRGRTCRTAEPAPGQPPPAGSWPPCSASKMSRRTPDAAAWRRSSSAAVPPTTAVQAAGGLAQRRDGRPLRIGRLPSRTAPSPDLFGVDG